MFCWNCSGLFENGNCSYYKCCLNQSGHFLLNSDLDEVEKKGDEQEEKEKDGDDEKGEKEKEDQNHQNDIGVPDILKIF